MLLEFFSVGIFCKLFPFVVAVAAPYNLLDGKNLIWGEFKPVQSLHFSLSSNLGFNKVLALLLLQFLDKVLLILVLVVQELFKDKLLS